MWQLLLSVGAFSNFWLRSFNFLICTRETSYSEIALDDVDRPPTSEEMNTWVGDCHSITAEELGKVLVKLEDYCPQCLVKRIESNEVEVNVDLVTGKAFREISAILRIYLPEGAARRKPRRVVDSVLKK
jgi:hypothetical protein